MLIRNRSRSIQRPINLLLIFLTISMTLTSFRNYLTQVVGIKYKGERLFISFAHIRLINALVEHSSLIPYSYIYESIVIIFVCFEAQLWIFIFAGTRFLRDSKVVLLKDLYLELERMKEDVRAARDYNGVYIGHERYTQEEAEKKARIQRIKHLENELNLSETEVSKFSDLYEIEKEKLLDVESDLKDCKRDLDISKKELLDLKQNYIQVTSQLKEREFSRMKDSDASFINRAKGLRSDLQHASDDITSLFTRLDQKDKLESENQSMLLKFGSQLDQNLKDLHRTVLGSVSQQHQQLRTLEEHTHSFLAHKYDVLSKNKYDVHKHMELVLDLADKAVEINKNQETNSF